MSADVAADNPTELAETGYWPGDTPLAWATEGEDDPPARHHSWRRWLIVALLVCLALAGLSVACVAGYRTAVHQGEVRGEAVGEARGEAVGEARGDAQGAARERAALIPPVPEERRDATYIDMLDKAPIRYTSRDGAIQWAHAQCGAIREGMPSMFSQSTLGVMHPEYKPQERAFVVVLTIAVYCPDMIGH